MSQADSRFGNGNGTTGGRPANELELWQQAIDPSVDGDEFLASVNMGLGNYDERRYWMQVESYRWGMYADAAFTRRLIDRAIYHTQRELGRTGWMWWDDDEDDLREELGWEDLDEADRADTTKREYLEKRGREIWRQLPEEERESALADAAGITRDWRPPHWRMLMMRHESSKSLGARLLDNVFGRVTEMKTEGAEALRQLEQLGGSE